MHNVHGKCEHFETKNFRIRVGVLRVQCAYFVAMLVSFYDLFYNSHSQCIFAAIVVSHLGVVIRTTYL